MRDARKSLPIRGRGNAPLIAAVTGVITKIGALLLAAVVSYRVRVDRR